MHLKKKKKLAVEEQRDDDVPSTSSSSSSFALQETPASTARGTRTEAESRFSAPQSASTTSAANVDVMKTDGANVDNENKELDDAEEELKEAEKELKEAKKESKEAEKELHEAEAEFLKELAASTDEDKIASARRLYDMKIKAWELCENKVTADRKRVDQLWGSFFLLLLFLQRNTDFSTT